MSDANGVLGLVDVVGSNLYFVAGLCAVILAVILIGIPRIARGPRPHRRRPK